MPKDHVDEFKSIKKFKVFNTNNLWVKLSAIKDLLEQEKMDMDVIVNRKVREGERGRERERGREGERGKEREGEKGGRKGGREERKRGWLISSVPSDLEWRYQCDPTGDSRRFSHQELSWSSW